MNVCYFGIYNPNHPRNKVLLQYLQISGVNVREINTRGGGLRNYWRLFLDLHRSRRDFDVVICGFPGQQATLVARLAFRGPMVWNALLSLYDAMIGDRKKYGRYSLHAFYFWLLDFMAGRAADRIIFDCDTYGDYYASLVGIPRQKCSRLFLGANEKQLYPLSDKENSHVINYYGSFLPTHGTEVIVQAAKLLENDNLKFVFSGNGPCLQRDKGLCAKLGVSNIVFIDRLSGTTALNEFINSSLVCLGLFSDIPKTRRAIASKVFEALCCARPVITRKSPASEELLTNGDDALLIPPENPEALADAIRLLMADKHNRRSLGISGRKVFEREASARVGSRVLMEILESVLRRKK